ncbi:thump domain-containing protein 3-like protein [Chrysochromulina tobinii]|uniref:RING-type E3 ubiquitin transferase n=1 Tax=Chrysochromulina tobinii TaxID=1460289 RepID=A0A0M0K6D5_9EUKA|nr:thump domain-containing protein 3-like protein [Chrysochromulina tobinii]|eukprot:KOO34431.1 thump domain-containing protein 3-like protein [Chrysochromulina sp. CCMP291]
MDAADAVAIAVVVPADGGAYDHAQPRLRPSACHGLLLAASLQRCELLLDPMCGVGSIPAEALRRFGASFVLGGDSCAHAVKDAARCVRTSGLDTAHWDVRQLPLRSGVADRLVVDMPWGNRGKGTLNQATLHAALVEIGRVLTEGGTAVLLLLRAAAARISRLDCRPLRLLDVHLSKVGIGEVLIVRPHTAKYLPLETLRAYYAKEPLTVLWETCEWLAVLKPSSSVGVLHGSRSLANSIIGLQCERQRARQQHEMGHEAVAFGPAAMPKDTTPEAPAAVPQPACTACIRSQPALVAEPATELATCALAEGAPPDETDETDGRAEEAPPDETDETDGHAEEAPPDETDETDGRAEEAPPDETDETDGRAEEAPPWSVGYDGDARVGGAWLVAKTPRAALALLLQPSMVQLEWRAVFRGAPAVGTMELWGLTAVQLVRTGRSVRFVQMTEASFRTSGPEMSVWRSAAAAAGHPVIGDSADCCDPHSKSACLWVCDVHIERSADSSSGVSVPGALPPARFDRLFEREEQVADQAARGVLKPEYLRSLLKLRPCTRHPRGGRHPAARGVVHAEAESKAAENAAGALWNIAGDNRTNQDAIREAGAIPPLVALLHAGAESKAAKNAAGALGNLAINPTSLDAIREAGAISPLVALLHAGAESKAAKIAAGALRNIAGDNRTNQDAIREAGAIPPLVALLHAGAESKAAKNAADALWILARDNRTNQDGIREAGAIPPLSVGLNVPLPADFTCPITYDKMKDPVVASDGHSYERSAIEEILRGPHPLSPLTRATLGTTLVPNLNLRRRIEDHEAELDRMAEQMAARLATAVAEAESAANVKEAAAKAKEAAAEAKEAAANAKEAAASAEIEALRKQLADAKKRVRTEDDHTEEPWEEQDPPAPKRRAPSSRRSTGSGAGGSA